MKALAEIYITHSFAPLSDLNFFVSKIAKMLPNFAEMLLESRCFPNFAYFKTKSEKKIWKEKINEY